MRSKWFCGYRLCLLVLVSWLAAAGVYPAAYAVDGGSKQARAGTRQAILILVDQLKGEDLAAGILPFATRFTARGGAGYMHTLPQWQLQKQDRDLAPLQLDAAGGMQLIRDSLQQAGVKVQKFPRTGMHRQDPLYPGGSRLAVQEIAAAVRTELLNANDSDQFVLVEFDELSRVEAAKDHLHGKQYLKYRQQAIDSLNRLTDEMLTLAGPSTMVMLAPTNTQQTHKELQPLFTAGGIIPANSFLTSASTRRAGIITAADAAASIFQHYGLEQPSITGQPIYGTGETKQVTRQLQSMWHQIQETYLRRPAVLTAYAICAICTLCMMVLLRLFLQQALGWRLPVQTESVLKWCSTAVLVVPLVFLCVPINPLVQGAVWTLTVTAATLGLTAALLRFRTLAARIGVLSVLYLTAVVGDCMTGSQLARHSILSYDPIVGIRFYGVGNEYLGVAVGWFILGSASLVTLWRNGRAAAKWLLPAVGLGLALFFASPHYGANAGGTVTAAIAAAAVAICLLKPSKLTACAIILLFTVLPVMLMFVMHRQELLPTHISLADNWLQNGGFQQLQAFTLRKLAMNFQLINNYSGGVLPLVGLGCLISVTMRPNRLVAAYFDEYPAVAMLVRTGVWAAAAAFVTNDSGVVAAAMILLPVLFAVSMIMLEAIPIHYTAAQADVLQSDTPDFWTGTEQGH